MDLDHDQFYKEWRTISVQARNSIDNAMNDIYRQQKYGKKTWRDWPPDPELVAEKAKEEGVTVDMIEKRIIDFHMHPGYMYDHYCKSLGAPAGAYARVKKFGHSCL